MKYKYTKYVPNLLDDLDMDELMSKLSDLLMSSGFGNPRDTGDDSDRTMQALHDAILEALFNGGVLPEDLLERLFGDSFDSARDSERLAQDRQAAQEQLEALIEQIIERMKESGYITTPPDLDAEKARRAQGGAPGEGEPGHVTFEVTDKALDFLGYRALRDLLGSSGHSSAGRHDTRDLSTGVETSGAPKPYEFGDTMNIDATATILNAVQRQADERVEAGLPPSREALRRTAVALAEAGQAEESSADGSCMIVVATDAPLDARNLQRLAARAIFALARTGSTYSSGSGDFAIAFSTHPSLRVTSAAGPQARTVLPTDAVSGLFEAVLDATEEAIDNSLLTATDVTGNGRTIRAIPVDALRALLKKYGR